MDTPNGTRHSKATALSMVAVVILLVAVFFTVNNSMQQQETRSRASHTSTSTTPKTFISLGDTWKYLDNNTRPSGWHITTYSDSAWASGRAKLGYGNGDEQTRVSYGSRSYSKYITTYFRKSFTITDPSAISNLTLRMMRDDGAVVYLNGTEIYRTNMPTGTISHSTYANGAISGTDESILYSRLVNAGLLRAGTNVIAVEVHQFAPDSDDIRFDLTLTGTETIVPPTPTNTPTRTPTPVPPTPTNTPAPLPTDTPTPTPSPIVTLVPTATPTSLPTPTTGPTATPVPGNTILKVNLLLHGIGRGGDSANPNALGNNSPLRPQRTITVDIYDAQNQLALSKQGTVLFNNVTGSFTGDIDLGTQFPGGVYTIRIKTDQYLRGLVSGIQSINQGQSNTLPSLTLIAGDVNNDNQINIIDYNLLTGCYSDLLPAIDCTPANKILTDFNDDGNTNQFDYNLFLRELTNIGGQ